MGCNNIYQIITIPYRDNPCLTIVIGTVISIAKWWGHKTCHMMTSCNPGNPVAIVKWGSRIIKQGSSCDQDLLAKSVGKLGGSRKSQAAYK